MLKYIKSFPLFGSWRKRVKEGGFLYLFLLGYYNPSHSFVVGTAESSI